MHTDDLNKNPRSPSFGSHMSVAPARGARSSSSVVARMRRVLWVWPIVAITLLSCLGWYLFRVVERSAQHNISNYLQTLLNANVAALSYWFSTQESIAQSIVTVDEVRNPALELAKLYQEPNFSALKILESPAFKALRTDIKPHLEAHDIVGFMLVTRDGTNIGSTYEELIGKKPARPESVNRFIAEAGPEDALISVPFKSAFLLPDEDSQIRAGVPLMLAMAPVVDDNNAVVAVFTFHLTPGSGFTEILQTARSGNTGETYAFNQNGLILSQSRFDDELRDIGLLPADKSVRSILNIELRDPGVNMVTGGRPSLPRSEQPLTRMAQSATTGNSGVDTIGYADYRGVPTVGAWTWLPKYGMGIVTKIDRSEALLSLDIIRRALWGTFVLLVIGAIAVFVFTVIIAKLSRKARQAALEAQELGQYTLLEKIGAGGMGVVYAARHAMLRRKTAVKLLNIDKITPETVARFEREVQLTSQLDHPSTVAVYDYGQTPEGIVYYAMEFLDGITLQKLVDQHGAQSEGRVVEILVQVCGSLAEAHSLGLMHRDIKPENIMLNRRGGEYDVVKVLDFGLAKAVDKTKATTLTTAGQWAGTPAYMSPEAINTPDSIDARSDIYAVGAVAYFLLTGTRVFHGETLSQLFRNIAESPVEPASSRLGRPISPELERILQWCLNKKPEDRPQSASELRRALERCTVSEQWTSDSAYQWWERTIPSHITLVSGGEDSTKVMSDEPPPWGHRS